MRGAKTFILLTRGYLRLVNNTIAQSPKFSRVLPAFLIGGAAAFFITSFLINFYSGTLQFIFLTLIITIFCATTTYWIFFRAPIESPNWTVALALIPASSLALNGFALVLHFPTLFDSRLLFIDSSRVPTFTLTALCSLPLAWLLVRRELGRCNVTSLHGLVLAALFFITYFLFAATVNFPGHYTLDQYFDIDISAWLARLQAASASDITDGVRAVHPAVLLFLRPLVWFTSLCLNGDRLHAVFIVHALAAAGCVFLVWRIVRRASGNDAYAVLIASLLGVSTSHLILGSMIETYIYSALAVLFFVSLVQNESPSLKSLVPAGVLVFGITITNLAQTAILFFVTQPRRIKTLIQYGLLVVAIGFVLNLIQVALVPVAQPLSLSNVRAEQGYQFDAQESAWRMRGRVVLTIRAVALYGIVAPEPFILTKELGVDFPNFRTFKISDGEFHVAGYSGLGDVLAKTWMLILAASLALFAWDWLKGNRNTLALGLLLCVGFNLALHVIYGDDPLLYSPDWVYALVLFVAFALQRFAAQKWFLAALSVFLIALITNNLYLLEQIMQASAPFYGR